MRLTNKHNLPQPIYDAVAKDPYSKGNADYSVTGLLKPPRQAQLERMYHEQYDVDVCDRIDALWGQAIHIILERAEKVAIAEERLYMTLDGIVISGQADRFVLVATTLQDYKTCAMWKTADGVPADWIAQLNMYRVLLEYNGYTVEKLEAYAIYRDWKRRMAKAVPGYPLTKLGIFDVPLWTREQTFAFMRQRIKLHQDAKSCKTAAALPVCSTEDLWQDQDIWAVHKANGRKTSTGKSHAVALYPTEEAAILHVERFGGTLGSDYSIEFRPGKAKHCEHCPIAQFCTQKDRLIKEGRLDWIG